MRWPSPLGDARRENSAQRELVTSGLYTTLADSTGAGRCRPGSKIVSSLPAPTLRRAIRHPKFAQAQAFVLHNPRSTGQEGFEQSLITSTMTPLFEPPSKK